MPSPLLVIDLEHQECRGGWNLHEVAPKSLLPQNPPAKPVGISIIISIIITLVDI